MAFLSGFLHYMAYDDLNQISILMIGKKNNNHFFETGRR